MKAYTIFLIYCIGRDIYSYWERTPYDTAYEEAGEIYKVFKKHYNKNEDLYLEIENFMACSSLYDEVLI